MKYKIGLWKFPRFSRIIIPIPVAAAEAGFWKGESRWVLC